MPHIFAQFPFINRVSFVDKLLFTKHLATMIKAGVPIAESLESLRDQSKSGTLRSVLQEVHKDVVNGLSLTEAFLKFPHIFSQFYISMVQVGEEGGTLEESLQFLAKQLSKDYALRQKIKGAMMYPALVFFATTIMGGFISLVILPKLVSFFDAFEIQLPITTQILLFVANFMKDYGILFFAGIGVLFFCLYLLLQTKHIQPRWHRFKFKLPLFGKLILYGQLTRFARNLGVLLQSGVTVTSSLETTAHTMSNVALTNDLLEINEQLKKGKKIVDSLSEDKFAVFPGIVTKMIGVGEKTGNLEEVLLYLADFYEEEIDQIAKNITTVLEPILLLAIGLIVGFVALAIISPIYELTGSIRR